MLEIIPELTDHISKLDSASEIRAFFVKFKGDRKRKSLQAKEFMCRQKKKTENMLNFIK